MNKKAWTISWAELIGLFLVFFVLVAVGPKLYTSIKNIVVKETDAGAKEQLDNFVNYINVDIDNIKRAEVIYPIDLDGSKYALAADNCEIDEEGKCKKQKTKLCLRRVDIEAKDYCPKKTLDFAFNSDFYPMVTKNFLIKWENNRISLYSS